tara:strand:- start:15323 stop:15553 length:231 start_codon:yes stop_codon:yes gene_type:complete
LGLSLCITIIKVLLEGRETRVNLSNDSAWDIKKEGHLNPNNIIFQDKKYIELYRNMKKQNDKIKRRKINEDTNTSR